MRYLLIFATFLTVNAYAQSDTLPLNEKGRVEFTEVIAVDSATDLQLFSRAKEFVATNFVSGKKVTDLEDEINKTIIVKGRVKLSTKLIMSGSDGGTFKFILEIRCKNGKYKYNFYDFMHEGAITDSYMRHSHGAIENEKPAHTSLPKKEWNKFKMQVLTEIKNAIAVLKTTMAKKQADW